MRALAIVVMTLAGAESKVAQATAEVELTEAARSTNEKCGTALAATIDWGSFGPADWSGKNVSALCAAPLNELAGFCAGPNARAYIKENVKKLVCRYGGPGKRAVTFKAGTVEQRVDFEAYNNEQFARAELIKSL